MEVSDGFDKLHAVQFAVLVEVVHVEVVELQLLWSHVRSRVYLQKSTDLRTFIKSLAKICINLASSVQDVRNLPKKFPRKDFF